MKKKGLWLVFIVILVILIVVFSNSNKTEDDMGGQVPPANTSSESGAKIVDSNGNVFHVDLEVFKTLLTDSRWQWVETIYSDDTIIIPKDSEKFSLIFGKEGKVTGKTDCNDVSARFELSDGTLTFSQIAKTKMACSGEVQEAEFIKILERAQGFLFTADGYLAITLKYDSGSAIFEPVR